MAIVRMTAAEAKALRIPSGTSKTPVRGTERQQQAFTKVTIEARVLPCIAQMIEIPLPPKYCSPNGAHLHWAVKAKARKQYRQEAWGACVKQRREPMVGLVRVRIDVYAGPTQEFDKRYRPLDAQNLIASLKAAIDGIVDAGVLVGDSKQYLCWGEVVFYTRKRQHQGRACVELWLETCD